MSCEVLGVLGLYDSTYFNKTESIDVLPYKLLKHVSC